MPPSGDELVENAKYYRLSAVTLSPPHPVTLSPRLCAAAVTGTGGRQVDRGGWLWSWTLFSVTVDQGQNVESVGEP